MLDLILVREAPLGNEQQCMQKHTAAQAAEKAIPECAALNKRFPQPPLKLGTSWKGKWKERKRERHRCLPDANKLVNK